MVLRGDAGFGETALLIYLLERAAEFQVARATGVESEMDLAYVGIGLVSTPFASKL